jgi:pyruvate dehydrogenase E1 component alpha subunit
MHIFDAAVNFSCSGIIAQGMAPAVGYGLAANMQGRDDVAVSFIGEGAANQGAFHESINLAALWNAPVVFIIEDNSWGISVAKSKSSKQTNYSSRAAAYGIPGIHVPGNDPDAIYQAAGRAIESARAGGGPTLIEIETMRLEGHFIGDAEAYRPEHELPGLIARDPIPTYRGHLLSEKIADEGVLEGIEQSAIAKVDVAITYARAGEMPAADSALSCVTL